MTRNSALYLLSSTLVALSLFAGGASAFTLVERTTVPPPKVPQPKVGKESVTAVHPPKLPAVQHKGGKQGQQQ